METRIDLQAGEEFTLYDGDSNSVAFFKAESATVVVVETFSGDQYLYRGRQEGALVGLDELNATARFPRG